jgi:hypothetical protein
MAAQTAADAAATYHGMSVDKALENVSAPPKRVMAVAK